MSKPILIVRAKYEDQAESIKEILKNQGVYEQFIVLIYGGELDVTLDGKTISPHNQIPYVPPEHRARIERIKPSPNWLLVFYGAIIGFAIVMTIFVVLFGVKG